jgi:hypothetical protein
MLLPHAGGWARSLRETEGVILAAVASDPGLTLAALCTQVEQGGGPQVSEKTMCLELQRLKLPLKKSPSTRVNGRHRG